MLYPKLIESKTLDKFITQLEWNPTMDLLATLFDNGTLTCSRLLSLQKVWHKQLSDTISVRGRDSYITWRPDGRVLAVSDHDDRNPQTEFACTLYDVEKGKQINTILRNHNITSIGWFEERVSDDQLRIRKNSLPFGNEKEAFSHQLAHEQTQLNLLTLATEDGGISFYALGLFPLGYIKIFANNSSTKTYHTIRIVDTHMSTCLRYLTVILKTIYTGGFYDVSIRIIKLDPFQRRSNEILRVAKMYAKITDELEYLDDTMNAITTSWADVLAGLDSKLSMYSSRKSKKPNESRFGYTFLSADELLQLLVIGFPSDNLEKFLSDMSEKGLKKLNSAIEQTCLRVQNLIVKNAQKCCYHLHSDLNLLRGMSLWYERYQEVGLFDKFIVAAMQAVGSLLLKLTELQQVIDHSLKSTKSFFRWLISIACRIVGEQNSTNAANEANKTTQQDIQLITDFILENFDYNHDELDGMSSLMDGNDKSSTSSSIYSNRPTCSNFTLEQVGQYLKNEPLSRQKYSFVKPESNFWIEFFKSIPEVTEPKILEEDNSSIILFYPHSADTSLIQEYKKTCQAIESAFKSVSTNMQMFLSQSETFFQVNNLRYLNLYKIRVETNPSAMKHYTLFLIKSTSNVYLLTQSLVDKTFQLLHIKFRCKSSKACICDPDKSRILVQDLSFYEEKETKKMLLTFLLLESVSDVTLIVQLELDSLYRDDLTQRTVKDLPKVFRNDASLEKHSCEFPVGLDLHTEEPSKRYVHPGVMVKRIRNTFGTHMFCSSSRGVIAFTCIRHHRLYLYEMEPLEVEQEMEDDEGQERRDESLMDTEALCFN